MRADVSAQGLTHFLEHQYKRTPALWRSMFINGVLSPAFFLLAIGVGLGSLVDRGDASGFAGPSYLAFVGPALLATTAMQWSIGESLWPTVAALKWEGSYKAAVATPATVDEVATGHLLWITLRFFAASVLFTFVLALFGVPESWWIVLAPFAAALTAAACASVVTAFSSAQPVDQYFPIVMRLVVVPMFLFSGSFFPLSELPTALAWIARATPAWHGVELCRGLSLGTLGIGAAFGHSAYLIALAVIGSHRTRSSFRLALTGARS